nr:Rne/Rng family ribonuclease [Corynebacterium sp. sy039]
MSDKKKKKSRLDQASIDQSIGESIRVYALAKYLHRSSKDIVTSLQEHGIAKRAQSNLSRQEALQVIEWLGDATGETAGDGAEAEEKLRHRIEKNVENEIHQIEQKVEKDLNEKIDDAQEKKKLRHQVEKNVENEVHQIEQKVEQELEQRLSNDSGTGDSSSPHKADEADLAALSAAVPLFLAPQLPEPELEDYAEEDDLAASADNADSADSAGNADNASNVGKAARKESADTSPKTPQDSQDAEQITEPVSIHGSTRLEAQRRRRAEMREEARKKRHVVSQAEFLARRESVVRTMIVRERERTDHPGSVTQVCVLEDGMMVEHFVTSEAQASMIGNIYLGRVQNVLPSMEAAFIDIGKGRNGVLYAGEVNWRQAGLGGKSRKIEHALKSGDQVLVQVTKDPVGQKGARLTTQISLAGRYLVYVPEGRSAGISRKLPAPERKRLKDILRRVVPKNGGTIIRTAAEGVSEQAIAADVQRLHNVWEHINELSHKEKESKGAKPVTLYEEPNMLVKVIRDLFNEDFSELIVEGKRVWNIVHAYISSVAPDLSDKLIRFNPKDHGGQNAFEVYRVDEQLEKALSRKVWLPSGGTLIIDRTEAMTVIDVNTGKFTGSGGNLEETVTRNNLEAAEEIVRQMRLRDLGGMIVIDFIDMVLPENQDLVLRRLKETLGRDRTRHQISEVTSLGLVQVTRKRLGTGLLETFATECQHCEGRGVIVHADPVEYYDESAFDKPQEQDQESTPDADSVAPSEKPAKAKAKRSIEELAAAVIKNMDTDSDEDSVEQDVIADNSRSNTTADTSVLDIVDSALARAHEEDPDEPSAQNYLPADDYAFDRKQRQHGTQSRRRVVRANSAAAQEKRTDEQHEAATHEAVRGGTQAEETKTVGSSRAAVKRRRAVRKNTHAVQAEVIEIEQTSTTHPEQQTKQTKQSVRESAKRHRRRVVRKNKHMDEGDTRVGNATRDVVEVYEKQKTSHTSGRGRGRRRVTRKHN